MKLVNEKFNWFWQVGFKKTIYHIVLVSMVLSTIMPALVYPVEIDFSFGSNNKIEEIVFSLLGAQAAKAESGFMTEDQYIEEYQPDALEESPTEAQPTPEVPTADETLREKAEETNKFLEWWEKSWNKQHQTEMKFKTAVFIALKQGLSNLLNTLAFDLADWLASAGEGQQPMFLTDQWDKYLINMADGALGTFLDKLSSNWLGFNICEPSFSVKISVGLGIAQRGRPQVDCTVSKMVKNWENFVTDPNFLNKFEFAFDPEQNDIGIAINAFDASFEFVDTKLNAAANQRQEDKGLIGKISKITHKILTPTVLVEGQARRLTDLKDPEWEKVQYGDIALDAIGMFAGTLLGKLFQRLFKEGLALIQGSGSSGSGGNKRFTSFGDLSNLLGQLGNLNINLFGEQDTTLYSGDLGTPLYIGQQATKTRFLDFLQTGIFKKGPYDVLSRLSFCPDPKNPGPDECVIKPDFRAAIEQQLILRDAITQGYIDGDAPFGFMDYDASAPYKGISYRSILILRAHRIIPATWELAAQAISRFDPGKIFSLNDLINQFGNPNSLYYGLIDPNWVLKLPDHFCKAEGYGQQVIYEDVTGGVDKNNDGDFEDAEDQKPRRIVGRTNYCADFQSCIKENADGTCQYYGYCTEERRIWNLNGTPCPDYANTCENFQNSSKKVVSYLKNTLDYNGCSIDNTGCRWYCQNYNPVDNVWSCTNETERILKPCTQRTCSLSGTICTKDSDCRGGAEDLCNAGCKLTANCDIPENETSCSDVISSFTLNISEPCSASSKWWDGAKCKVNTTCNIPTGGISCVTTSCDTLTNLLPNPGFETTVAPSRPSDPNQYIGATWYTDSNGVGYFESVSGATEKVHAGKRSLRFFDYGSTLNDLAIRSDSFKLKAGVYTFSGYVYNHLNAGDITLVIAGNVTTPTGTVIDPVSKMASAKNEWQRISFDFKVPNDTAEQNVEIKISRTGGLISGSAWFDDLKISETCITNQITLTLTGTIESDQSKIHLDRDAEICPATAAGCSEFIRTKVDLGTNVVPNSSFEIWPETGVSATTTGWQISDPTKVIRNVGESAVGNSCLVARSDGTNDLKIQTDRLVSVAAGTYYYLSFWAKTDTGVNSSIDSLANLQWTGGNGASQSWTFKFNNNTTIVLSDQWQRFVSAATTTPGIGSNFALLFNIPASFASNIYIDGVQLEAINPGSDYTSYKDYGLTPLTYLKKPPASLGCTGDYLNDPAECSDYALYCRPEEAGCEAYTPVGGGPVIPGVAVLEDYCPAECIGYDTYKQSTTFFESHQTLENFIPRTAIACQASEQGCDEFTNLDKASSGGEAKEQYQYLRLCKKPTETNVNCQNFYTWQGSDESGYQLQVYNLSAVPGGGPEQVINYSASNASELNWPDYWCYNRTDGDGNGLPDCCDDPTDIAVNPFCKELYGIDGKIYYQIFANTITCSDDCHPYRKTRLGESSNEAKINCDTSHGDWDSGMDACVYKAIPGQGIACDPSAVGCREYKGNAGGNIFVAYSNNFESGAVGWRYGDISSVSLSVGGHSLKSIYVPESNLALQGNHQAVTTFASLAGNKECSDRNFPACGTLDSSGNAIVYNCYNQQLGKCVARDEVSPGKEICYVAINQVSCGTMNNVLKPAKSYLLSFWAKTDSENIVQNVSLDMVTSTLETGTWHDRLVTLGTVKINPDWNYYTFGPFVYEEVSSSPNVRLRIKGPTGTEEALTGFYIDNIIINEVKNYVYVIKGSWRTPESCDTNPFLDAPIAAPQFMLGCRQYRDFYNRIHNLKSFTRLCRQEAAGCEALIDTYNLTSPFNQTFNPGDQISQVDIPADRMTYMVNRPRYQCEAEYKGCQVLGQPAIDVNNQIVSYQTVYKVNNPDQYESSLCSSEEVSCDEFQTATGYAYFKDPGLRTCEYRLIPNQNSYAWFKSGQEATTTPDCPLIQPVIGAPHPTAGLAGICSSQYSTCSQFIDPTTEHGKNLIFNADFRQDIDNNSLPDGWNLGVANPAYQSYLNQQVELNRGTLYVLSINNKDTNSLRGLDAQRLSFEIRDCPNISSFDYSLVNICTDRSTGLAESPQKICKNDNDCSGGECLPSLLAIPQGSYAGDNRTDLPGQRQYSGRFFIANNKGSQICKVQISSAAPDPLADIKARVASIELKEAEIDYVLGNSVDKLSCNGLVNQPEGCVLFNDRSRVNYKLGENDISYLVYDSDVSSQATNNGIPALNCAGNCDSNVVLKVKPDRICNSWLYCSSWTTLGGNATSTEAERNLCTSIGQCNSLAPNGTCDGFIIPKKGDERSNAYAEPKDVSNLSGYTKAGLDFRRQIVAAGFGLSDPKFSEPMVKGYYPYSEMTQEGGIAFSAGTNFESDLSKSTQPFGWRLEYPLLTEPAPRFFSLTNWRSEYAKLINNPVSAQKEGLKPYAPEGESFVKINGPYVISSQEIDVFGGKEYIISAYINTLSLLKGDARIRIREYNAAGEQIAINPRLNPILRLEGSNDWIFKQAKFVTQGNTTRIKILLSNWNETLTYANNPWTGAINEKTHDIVGASYFDGILIKPSLQIDKDAFIQQSCRLYPAADSLSCDYKTADNLRMRGWLGYCVEKDPANPDQCLMWWPVDLIQGGFTDEQPPLTQVPLYYCLQAKEDHYDYRHCLFQDAEACASKNATFGPTPANRSFVWTVPADWKIQKWQIGKIRLASSIDDCVQPEGSSGNCGRTFTRFTLNDITGTQTSYTAQYESGNIGGTFGLIKSRTSDNSIGVKLQFNSENNLESIAFDMLGGTCLCPDADISIEVKRPWCQYVVQTVTPFGNQKPWWNRISPTAGQGYSVPGLYYYYSFDYPPFAAIVPPVPTDNPEAWTNIIDKYNRPLFVQRPNTKNYQSPYQVRAGLPYACSQTSKSFKDSQGQDIFCSYPNARYDIASAVRVKDTAGAEDNLKRLFARNYGAWQYQGDGVCKDSHSQIAQPEIDCACPDSVCGLYIQKDYNYCGSLIEGVGSLFGGSTAGVFKCSTTRSISCEKDNDCPVGEWCEGQASACEVSGWKCLDFRAVLNVFVSAFTETEFTHQFTVEHAIIVVIVKLIFNTLTSCSPKKCDPFDPNACAEGEGPCVSLLDYLTAGYRSDYQDFSIFTILNWISIPLGGLVDLFSSIFIIPGEEGGSGNLGQDFLNQIQLMMEGGGGEWNEAILEGKVLRIPGMIETYWFGEEIGMLVGSYCAGTTPRCSLSANFGSRCCMFFGSCDKVTAQEYRCLGGSNKGLICNPRSDDNCPSGYNCQQRKPSKAYISVGGFSWIEPTDMPGGGGLCNINDQNKRPKSACNGNKLVNYPCVNNSDCNIFGRCDGSGFCKLSNEEQREDQNCLNTTDKVVAGNICVYAPGTCEFRDEDDPSITVPVPASGEKPDYCSVAPYISSFKVNSQPNGTVQIYGGNYIKLNFTTQIDSQQLPLSGYTIDWSDGNITPVTGQGITSRPQEQNPFSVSHLYSYWDLQAAQAKGQLKCPGYDRRCDTNGDGVGDGDFCLASTDCGTDINCVSVKCCDENECRVVPKVQIRDNWNWCNAARRCDKTASYCNNKADCVGDDNQCVPVETKQWGYYGGSCENANGWQPFAGVIKVYPYFKVLP